MGVSWAERMEGREPSMAQEWEDTSMEESAKEEVAKGVNPAWT